jgi:hypothetical protein
MICVTWGRVAITYGDTDDLKDQGMNQLLHFSGQQLYDTANLISDYAIRNLAG